MAVLQAHDWPGNVRELRNNIERLMILSGGDPDAVITADMLPEEIGSNVPLPVNGGAEHLMSLPLREAREIFEREYLLAQINRFGGNISRTAEFVGMERSALHRKLQSAGRQLAGARRRHAPEWHKAAQMDTRIVYVNGRYLPYARGRVHAEDRGFQFGDAVYEVCEVRGGRLVDETRHMAAAGALARRARHPPADGGAAPGRACCARPCGATACSDGLVYLQVVARRAAARLPVPARRCAADGRLPRAQRRARAQRGRRAEAGIAVKTMPDIRWGRCDIKTVMLLPASLAKEAARKAGAPGGLVRRRARASSPRAPRPTPGSSTARGGCITRQLDDAILRGVTRTTLIDVLRREGLELVERPFTVAEAKAAREAFITSATNIVMPVVRIDGQPDRRWRARAASRSTAARRISHRLPRWPSPGQLGR